LSISAEKCWASAAEPPLPQTRIFAVGHQTLHNTLRRIGNRGCEQIQRLQLEMGAFGKVVADSAD